MFYHLSCPIVADSTSGSRYYFVGGEDEEEKAEEEVSDVAEDVVEVDDVTNGDGAEEVVVAHVGIAGLHQLVLVVQYLGKMKEIRELLRKRTAVLFPHLFPGTNLGLGWGESVPLAFLVF